MANANTAVTEEPPNRMWFLLAAAVLIVGAGVAVWAASKADPERIEAAAFDEEPVWESETPSPTPDGEASGTAGDGTADDGTAGDGTADDGTAESSGDATPTTEAAAPEPLPLKTYNLNTPLSDPPFEPLETTEWFNSPPLTKADLEGRVVLYDFWTHGCVNCRNTIPSLKAWYERYADDGLEIIGVHTAEFEFEKDPGNIEAAIADLGVPWPVVNDPDKLVWRAFNTRFWPTMALYDETGTLRYAKKGEGRYAEVEDYIRDALGVDPDSPRSNDPEQV